MAIVSRTLVMVIVTNGRSICSSGAGAGAGAGGGGGGGGGGGNSW